MATPTNLPATFVAGNILTALQVNDLRGAFRVLQIVAAQYGTGVTNNSNVVADTGLTATITPQSTSSKILIMGGHKGMSKSAANAGNAIITAVLRGATILTYPSTGAGYTGTAVQNVVADSFYYLDSPATIAATTYKTQFSNVINAAGVSVQASVGVGFATSYIVLVELSF